MSRIKILKKLDQQVLRTSQETLDHSRRLLAKTEALVRPHPLGTLAAPHDS